MTDQDMKTCDPRIESDFRSDWIAILRAEITSLGYDVKQSWDGETISDIYFNLLRRIIEIKPRKVVQSREFTCPSMYSRGLKLIGTEATKGLDLNPRLSRKIKKAMYDDALLNDWDINHLHLGQRLQKTGQIEGTEYILLARVTHDILYMIDVLPHGSWSDRRLLEIVHQNWPESIEVSRVVGAIGLEYNPNSGDIAEGREVNLNMLLEMGDGTIYCPPGGGVTSSGVSVEVVERSNYHFRLIQEKERHCRENAPKIMKSAGDHDSTKCTDLRFELLGIGDGHASILERHSGYRFRIRL